MTHREAMQEAMRRRGASETHIRYSTDFADTLASEEDKRLANMVIPDYEVEMAIKLYMIQLAKPLTVVEAAMVEKQINKN